MMGCDADQPADDRSGSGPQENSRDGPARAAADSPSVKTTADTPAGHATASWFGVGLYGFADVNHSQSFVGVALGVELGLLQ